jgi:hypothetical protein
MKTDSERIKRRLWLGGAASVGAAVVGSMALSQRNPVAAVVNHADKAAPTSEPATGYQLTEHVKRYYATARV